jgi:hypothetical protein
MYMHAYIHRLHYDKTVPGTHSHHKLVTINTSEHLSSSGTDDMVIKVSVVGYTHVAVEVRQLCPGKYVAAV